MAHLVLIIGIDPGITGAVAFLEDGQLDKVEDLPVVEVKVGKSFRKRLVPAILANLFDNCTIGHVFLEEVASRPGEGAVGAFSFGRGFGQIEGVLAAMEIPFTLVRPGVWKKALGVPADKGSAIARACREWPVYASLFNRPALNGSKKPVAEDGRAEAALIALYGASQHAN